MCLCFLPRIDRQPNGLPDSCGCKAPDTLSHYIIIRSDLPLGFMAAQIVHAAGESSPGNLPPDTNAVVLSVAGEAALIALSELLSARGIQHHLVREPDAPWLGQATAIGIPPAPRSSIRPFVSSLPLLRERKGAV